MLTINKLRKNSNEISPNFSQSNVKKSSNDQTPNNVSFQPHFISEKEINELDAYLNHKQEPEPENEKHVKIKILPTFSKPNKGNGLPFEDLEEDDPDYLANLILINENRENLSKGIYMMNANMNIDKEFSLTRYNLPYFSNKENFKANPFLENVKSPKNLDSETKNDESDNDDGRSKPKNKFEV